jgi:hypothetical protein
MPISGFSRGAAGQPPRRHHLRTRFDPGRGRQHSRRRPARPVQPPSGPVPGLLRRAAHAHADRLRLRGEHRDCGERPRRDHPCARRPRVRITDERAFLQHPRGPTHGPCSPRATRSPDVSLAAQRCAPRSAPSIKLVPRISPTDLLNGSESPSRSVPLPFRVRSSRLGLAPHASRSLYEAGRLHRASEPASPPREPTRIATTMTKASR